MSLESSTSIPFSTPANVTWWAVPRHARVSGSAPQLDALKAARGGPRSQENHGHWEGSCLERWRKLHPGTPAALRLPAGPGLGTGTSVPRSFSAEKQDTHEFKPSGCHPLPTSAQGGRWTSSDVHHHHDWLRATGPRWWRKDLSS